MHRNLGMMRERQNLNSSPLHTGGSTPRRALLQRSKKWQSKTGQQFQTKDEGRVRRNISKVAASRSTRRKKSTATKTESGVSMFQNQNRGSQRTKNERAGGAMVDASGLRSGVLRFDSALHLEWLKVRVLPGPLGMR
jgi:hypothetical protein